MMVEGIKNSTHFIFILITSYTLNASVKECPMVKAVTKTNTCFQLPGK